jgi:hypothetical protein
MRPTSRSLPHVAHAGAPQPLKIQSTAPSTPERSSSSTNVGPESRIQKSSSGASSSSISRESMRRARAVSVGSTTIATGSKLATAWATAVHAA